MSTLRYIRILSFATISSADGNTKVTLIDGKGNAINEERPLVLGGSLPEGRVFEPADADHVIVNLLVEFDEDQFLAHQKTIQKVNPAITVFSDADISWASPEMNPIKEPPRRIVVI
jgi:hypothetical protein